VTALKIAETIQDLGQDQAGLASPVRVYLSSFRVDAVYPMEPIKWTGV